MDRFNVSAVATLSEDLATADIPLTPLHRAALVQAALFAISSRGWWVAQGESPFNYGSADCQVDLQSAIHALLTEPAPVPPTSTAMTLLLNYNTVLSPISLPSSGSWVAVPGFPVQTIHPPTSRVFVTWSALVHGLSYAPVYPYLGIRLSSGGDFAFYRNTFHVGTEWITYSNQGVLAVTPDTDVNIGFSYIEGLVECYYLFMQVWSVADDE